LILQDGDGVNSLPKIIHKVSAAEVRPRYLPDQCSTIPNSTLFFPMKVLLALVAKYMIAAPLIHNKQLKDKKPLK
jgi:hypothetical protein